MGIKPIRFSPESTVTLKYYHLNPKFGMSVKDHDINGENPKSQNKIARKREQLELLLDCRRYELLICDPNSWMYPEIRKDIAYLEKRLIALNNELGTETGNSVPPVQNE